MRTNVYARLRTATDSRRGGTVIRTEQANWTKFSFFFNQIGEIIRVMIYYATFDFKFVFIIIFKYFHRKKLFNV